MSYASDKDPSCTRAPRFTDMPRIVIRDLHHAYDNGTSLHRDHRVLTLYALSPCPHLEMSPRPCTDYDEDEDEFKPPQMENGSDDGTPVSNRALFPDNGPLPLSESHLMNPRRRKWWTKPLPARRSYMSLLSQSCRQRASPS